MKWKNLALSGLLLLALQVQAAVPPAEQLLPADTLVVVSVPDWDKAAAEYRQSPIGQLWKDTVLKPFKDKFIAQLKKALLDPLEREMGVKFSDFSDLLHGQLTVAVIQSGWGDQPDKSPGMLLLIDAKDKADALRSRLAELKKKWVEAGKQIKTEKVRDVEFSTLVVRKQDLDRALEKAFPPSADAQPSPKPESDPSEGQLEVSFGQSESLLLVGNSLKDMERILIRQSGGLVPTLADQPDYEANHAALFRDALSYGWVNFKPLYALISKAAGQAKPGPSDNPMAPQPEKILAATGLGGLKTIAFKASGSADGSFGEIFLGVPESNRQGIFKILLTESKEAGPPSFVPSDAVRFVRWRIDGQKAWATFEAMLNSISPELSGLLQMGLATVGKDKDPSFDLKRNLIGNLGDDFISFEKPPRSATLADLSSPPAIFLVGSANAEKLAQGVNAVATLIPVAATDSSAKEREFLGRKIYSVPLPPMPAVDGANPKSQNLSFAASGGYLALSTDTALLEDFLRSGEGSGKSLREATGLQEAAQKVGGTSTGFFGFENQGETMRATVETLKNDMAKLEKLFSMAALGSKLGSDGDGKTLKDWFDLTLLPSFDNLAKYFHIMVYSGSGTRDGLSWKIFLPTPPSLRK